MSNFSNNTVEILGGNASNDMWALAASLSIGAPTSGTWLLNQRFMDAYGQEWVCIVGGTPGTWMLVGNKPSALSYDSTTGWNTYTPTWTASLATVYPGNSTLTGRYQKVGRTCTFVIDLLCGSTVNGGSGYYDFTLPPGCVAGPTRQTNLHVLYDGYGISLLGFAYTVPGGTAVIPYLPTRQGGGMYDLQGACNESTIGGGPATSVPYVGGGANFPITSGANLEIWGTYETV